MEYSPPLRRIDPNILDISQLKPATGAQFQKLNPSVRLLWMVFPAILWTLVFTIIGAVFLINRIANVFDTDSLPIPIYPWFFVALCLVGLLAIWHLSWPWFSYSHWGYLIRRHDLLVRHGFIWRQVVAVPFARIQHVDSSAGPVSRILGLARIDIHTAGTAMAKISIPGLTAEDAEKLRDYLSKTGHSHANI